MNDYPVSVIPEGENLILWNWWVHLAEAPPAAEDLIEVIPVGDDGIRHPEDAIMVRVTSVSDEVDPPTITATWSE